MSLKEQLGTILMACIFALLIWLWSEGESRERNSTALSVGFAADSKMHLVRIRRQDSSLVPQINVRLELEGPNLQLQHVIGSVQELKIPVVIDDALADDTGENASDSEEIAIELRGELQDLKEFRENGISVISAEPARVTIRIDRIIEQPIRISPEIPPFDVEQIKITPDQADVAMPKALWEGTIRPQYGDAWLRLKIDRERLEQIPRGEPQMLADIPLQLDDRLARTLPPESRDVITIRQRTVNVELTLGGSTQFTLSVPVRISKPPLEEQNYDVLIDRENDIVQGVIVTGDSEAIEELRKRVEQRQTTVLAMVDLTSDEMEAAVKAENGTIERPVRWLFPEELSARLKIRNPPQPPRIKIRVVKRQAEQS